MRERERETFDFGNKLIVNDVMTDAYSTVVFNSIFYVPGSEAGTY